MFSWIIGLLGLLLIFVSVSESLEIPRFYGEEVVVTAAKYVQPRFKSPWNVAIIDEKEIKSSNAKTVGQILERVSGLDVRAFGGLGTLSTAGLRIIGAEKTLVLLDGRAINSPLWGGTDLNDLMLDNVEKIEIVKSPASALYGSEANGGAINIITKKGRERASDFAFNLGSFGTRQYKASLSNAEGYLLAETINSDGFRQNSDYNSVNLKGNYSWNLFNNSKLNLDVLFYNAQKGTPNVPSTDAWSASKPKDRQDDQNIYLDLSAKTEWQENSEFSSRIFRNSGNQTARSFDLPGTLETTSTNNFAQTGIEINNRQGALLYGVEYKQDLGNSSASGNRALNNIASYLQWESDLMNGGNFVAGIRGDRHSVAGRSFNPRAGILLPLKEDLFFRTTYGTSFRAPTINELYWAGPFSAGNINLKPEKSQTYEMGIRKIAGPSSIQLTYHNSDYNNLIYWTMDQMTFVTSPVNVASAKIEGLELEIEHQFSKVISGFANYTYQRSTGTDPTGTVTLSGEDLIFMPKNKGNAGLRFDGEGAGSAAVDIKYVGERNYIDAPPPAYANVTKQLPGYLTANAKLSKNFGKYNLSLGADNLFDASYNETVGFSPVSAQPALGYPAPGRKLTLAVEYKL